MWITLPTYELRYPMFNPAPFKNHTNNHLEIYTIQFVFQTDYFAWCVDILSIFVSYMNRGVDVPKPYW